MENIKDALRVVVLAIIFGAVAGAVASLIIIPTQQQEKTDADYISEFYLTENAVHVSPHSLRGRMDRGVNDYVLVDLRSAEEYEKEHIAGAISIPAYKDRDTSDYGAVDRIVSSFAALPKGREVIVYCYSMPCMTGRKVGKMLVEHGIYVRQLGIGWNEWRHFWNLWNHEHEWNTTAVQDYISSGKEPGVPKLKVNATAACPISGEFGC